MAVWLGLFCVVLLESITGVVCYDYGYGGMVAAAAAAFVLLAIIVVLIVMLALWRDWYMRKQARQGRYRIPRKKYRFFGSNSHSVISTPKSQRKMHIHNVRSHSVDSNRVVVLPAAPESNTVIYGRGGGGGGDKWITQIPSTNRYEEKSKSLKFEREEEAVIVADVLPGNAQHSTHWRQTVQQQPGTVLINSAQSPDTGAAHGTFQMNHQDPNIYTVPYMVDNEPTQLRETRTRTESADRVGPAPIHVHIKQVPWSERTTESVTPAQQLSQSVRPAQQVAQTSSNTQYLSQTARPTNAGEGITIAPLVPSTNFDNHGAGVVIFDSDDEHGNIAQGNTQGEDMVLF